MAINKLDLNFKNKGEAGAIPINPENLNKIIGKIDELVDFSTKTINSGDFNDVINTGICIMRSGCQNSPFGENATTDSHFYLITIQYSTSYIIQICSSIFTNDQNLYIRKKSGGNWKEWYKSADVTKKTGTFTNPDTTVFQVTDSKIVQIGNVVDVTLNLKLLKEVTKDKQYAFILSGVEFPKKEFISLGVTSASSYTAGNFLYTYLNSAGHLALKCNTAACAAGGSWYIHLTYLVD